MEPQSPEQRLVELESRHLHAERLLDKLNAVVIEQQAHLERLQRALERLEAQLLEGRAEPQDEERPPHY